MSPPARLLTQSELDALSVSADQRMRDALQSGAAEGVLETYSTIENTWRGFAGNLEDWANLTLAYLIEFHGRPQPHDELRLERVATLAVRRGIDSEQLALTRELLDRTEHPLRRRLRAALDAGDHAGVADAWHVAERLMRDAVTIRCENINDLLGYVYREHGADALEAAMRYAAERGFWREALPAQVQKDPEDRVREIAFFLTAGAGCELRITEDDERFVVEKVDCHCGRLVIDHRVHGWPMEIIEGPSPMTYGQQAMTPFQAHFAVIHGMWAIDVTGVPINPFECIGTKVGIEGHCRFFIYKARVPDRFYHELGYDRPPTVSGQP